MVLIAEKGSVRAFAGGKVSVLVRARRREERARASSLI